MRLLIALRFILGIDSYPVFKPGDCITYRSDMDKVREFTPASFSYMKIRRVGETNYLYKYLDIGTVNETRISNADEIYVKVKCPENSGKE